MPDHATALSSLLSRTDAVIVDLDGTLVDTMGDFNEALNRMLCDLGLPAIEVDAVLRAAPIAAMR